MLVSSPPVCAVLAILSVLAGCAPGSVVPADSSPASSAPAGAAIFLLGEVHDNPAGHAARLSLIEAQLAKGLRPAIAMEQFDRERQADLDRASATCRDAACVIAAVSGAASWNWDFYKPVIELALRYRLPLVAANLSRADASKVVRDGFAAALDAPTIAAYRLDQPLPPAVVAIQAEAIRIGHCMQLPEAMVPGMVRAQIARDVVMAQALRPFTSRGVLLLAGNGHVRRDAGVPVWRRGEPEALSIGYLEETSSALYDQRIGIAPHPRADPCAAFKPK